MEGGGGVQVHELTMVVGHTLEGGRGGGATGIVEGQWAAISSKSLGKETGRGICLWVGT